MPASSCSRTVAIVGRPNVGKSALFNRMVGRRLAIVHEESGVTRDRISAIADWNGQRFEMIDTGGISMMDRAAASDVLTEGMTRQVDVALTDACVAILTVDITAGLQPMDEEVARLLRARSHTVLVAANKCDHPELEDRLGEFQRLGFPVYPVSALHNRGIDDLFHVLMPLLPDADQTADTEPLKVAIVGRPNVGKSSYINRLLRSDRVLVSDIPGTTRDSIEIPFHIGEGEAKRSYLLTDTAGIRRKGKIKDTVERFSLMRTEKSIERADVVVMMLDAEQGPTAQDKTIASMVLKHRKGMALVINKWDLAEGKTTQRQYTKALAQAVPFLGFVPVVYCSAQSGYNIRHTIEAIDRVASMVRLECTTGLLNRVLHDAFTRVQPPVSGGRRFKMYYATQVGTRPVRIRLFVNEPKLLPNTYEQYLQRCLREAFGLEGAPIVLQFRPRAEKTKS
jgi:GTPase